MTKRHTYYYGFSLIEVLVAIAIFSFIALVVMGFFISMNFSSIRSVSNREVQENARRMMDTMTYEIRHANGIYTPTTTATQISLETTHFLPVDEVSTYIDFFLCGTDLCLKKESQSPIVLNSDSVEVYALSFTQILTRKVQSLALKQFSPKPLSIGRKILYAGKSQMLRIFNFLKPFQVFAAFAPPNCGDLFCDPSEGEDCNTCSDDCGDCPSPPSSSSGTIPSIQITMTVRYKNPGNDPASAYSITLTSTSSLRRY